MYQCYHMLMLSADAVWFVKVIDKNSLIFTSLHFELKLICSNFVFKYIYTYSMCVEELVWEMSCTYIIYNIIMCERIGVRDIRYLISLTPILSHMIMLYIIYVHDISHTNSSTHMLYVYMYLKTKFEQMSLSSKCKDVKMRLFLSITFTNQTASADSISMW